MPASPALGDGDLMPFKEEPDPVAEALADALPDLAHPSGQRVWLTGLAGDKMRRARATTAEAIVSWLRKRSETEYCCVLCGGIAGDAEAERQLAEEAEQRLAEAIKQAIIDEHPGFLDCDGNTTLVHVDGILDVARMAAAVREVVGA